VKGEDWSLEDEDMSNFKKTGKNHLQTVDLIRA
jgi:hypothetical protein